MTNSKFNNVKITGIRAVVPLKVLSVDDELQFYKNNQKLLERNKKILGVGERHVVDEGMTCLDLCEDAAKKLFKEMNVTKDDIDTILFVSICHDYNAPASACILQNRLSIPVTSGAFDYNLGCSGCIYGLALAKGLIVSGAAKNVLLLTAETYNKYLHPSDKSNKSIFGDGAAACLISTDGFAEIGEFSFGTDGSGAENLIVKTGASRLKEETGHYETDDEGHTRYDDFLYMNGGAIFNFTLETVPTLMNEVLNKNKMSQEEVDYFIFHQANKFMLNTIRKVCVIPKDKFYINLEETGNTVSSTVLIGLKECVEKEMVKPSQNIMITGFGVGLSWGGCILKF